MPSRPSAPNAALRLSAFRFGITACPPLDALNTLIPRLYQEILSGEHLVVHCLGGIGRTGLIASCLLIEAGLSEEAAMQQVSEKRTIRVPETAAQIALVRAYGMARGV
jgi:protein-tyrosine phosphatase